MLNNTIVSKNLPSLANTTSISISTLNSTTLDNTAMLVPNKNDSTHILAEHANGCIIDTRVTNHLTFDITLLNKESIVKVDIPKRLFLPNEDVSHVLHTGTSSLFAGNNRTDMFHVP